jgi:hypothetical protein
MEVKPGYKQTEVGVIPEEDGRTRRRGERGGKGMKEFSMIKLLRASAPPRETLHREAVWK